MAETTTKGRASNQKSRSGDGSTPAASAPPICSVGFCPICLAVTAVGEARPEIMEHVLLASRELLLAMRALIDARLEAAERSPKLQRLTIE